MTVSRPSLAGLDPNVDKRAPCRYDKALPQHSKQISTLRYDLPPQHEHGALCLLCDAKGVPTLVFCWRCHRAPSLKHIKPQINELRKTVIIISANLSTIKSTTEVLHNAPRLTAGAGHLGCVLFIHCPALAVSDVLSEAPVLGRCAKHGKQARALSKTSGTLVP